MQRVSTQATFGPKSEDITTPPSKGFDTRLNEQLDLPATSHLHTSMYGLSKRISPAGNDGAILEVGGDGVRDQLRPACGFALSQILVDNLFHPNLEGEPFALAGYLDLLNKDAFGNFRQLLEDVALSSMMGGIWIIYNDKEDLATGPNTN